MAFIKHCIPILILLNCLTAAALAQASKDNTVPLFFEKTYLHTDRNVYGQGDEVWYKAYVVNAQNNTSVNYSHNLYVELIGPDAKLIKRETIRLENGLGNGDFKLTDSIPAGRYRLRAYTNWMRNFGDNFVFEKNITVLQTAPVAEIATATKRSKKLATPSSVAASVTATPIVRFFPEGGSLVEGISSIVGIKAEDGYGKGIAAKGAVISSAGDTVTHFRCDSLGMGLLALMPAKGLSYRVLVDLAGEMPDRHNLVFALPPALSKGLTLQVKQTDSVIRAVISGSDALASNSITLVVKHGGKTQLSKKLQLQNAQTVANIPTAILAEGISAITLYDSQGKPECERLVYIHHPNNKSTITLTTDRKIYRPKGQVTISIQAPPNTSLSLAAVNVSTVPVQSENILSYLNLQSEVKGDIEKPNRYFDTTNVNRFKQLDQLLLTQGWRDFVWRRLEDTTLKLSYEPEQGINVTGKVRKVWTDAGVGNINITMHIPTAKGQKLFWIATDTSGRFAINNPVFYGHQYLSLTARRADKVNKKGESKGFSGGWLQVDSLLQDTLKINPVRLIPDTAAEYEAIRAIEKINRALNLKPDHYLKEVKIKSYTSRLPPEVHPITLTEQKEFDNLAQYLLYKIERSQLTVYPCSGCKSDTTSPLVPILKQTGMIPSLIFIHGVFSDGSDIGCPCQNEYLYLPMSNILKVTINRRRNMDAVYASVNIVLRPGVLDTKDYFDNTVADMVGYYKAREFYKPAAGTSTDPRTNTVHWEPNITTNEKGEASFSFYNTVQTGKIRLIVEGITTNGTPLVATSAYDIK